MDIAEMLNSLEQMQDKFALHGLNKEAAKEAQLTDEIRRKWQEIDDEYDEVADVMLARINELEQRVKEAVKEHGATVKANGLQAVYSPPRVTWDARSLDGYAINYPELFAFRKEGAPSVSIRVVNRR